MNFSLVGGRGGGFSVKNNKQLCMYVCTYKQETRNMPLLKIVHKYGYVCTLPVCT